MATGQARYSIDEVADRGTALYESKIRQLVEKGNLGRILAIDVDSGDYAVADQRYDAVTQVKQKRPDAQIWILRIGHVAVETFGGGDTREVR